MRISGDNNAIPAVGQRAEDQEHVTPRVRGSARAGDTVEISGRSDAAGSGKGRRDIGETGMNATLNKVHARFQERIRSGFYDTDEVLGSIASRVLDLFGL